MKHFQVLLLLLPILAFAGPVADERTAEDPPSALRTEKVRRGTVALTVPAMGTLEPEEVVGVGAQVSGQIIKFGPDLHNSSKSIDYGSDVVEGTVLAQLDDSLFKARVNQARAGLAKAEASLKLEEAQLRLAERERDRLRKRLADRTSTQEDLDEAAARCDVAVARIGVARAGVSEAQAALKEAELYLSFTTIRSPIKGVIVDRRVNVGQAVTSTLSSQGLFLIATDLKRLQVWASVSEADIANIQPGQQASYTVEAYPDRTFNGKVSKVRLNATRTQDVATYTVVVDTDNSDGKLLPYLTANLHFPVAERKDALLVPNAALRWKPQADRAAPEARAEPPAADRMAQRTGVVWVEDKDGQVRPVRLRLGLSDGAVTEVVGGELAEGQRVVTGKAAKAP
jgi:HlyD family secretion protein